MPISARSIDVCVWYVKKMASSEKYSFVFVFFAEYEN